MRMTIFLLLNASPGWLRLGRKERSRLAADGLKPFVRNGLSLRHFDAEAFHADYSDVAMIEAETPEAYYFAIEQLRDTALITEGYFSVAGIIPSYENGFRTYEAAHAV
ncbi:darcynin family protein [Leisingera sp. JC11]|uniref:darcynin family protein n=1 Tax=Leisingera sp. JC11 TaxID=3042469 RepID=UPI003452858C